jgi:hypothetical protein
VVTAPINREALRLADVPYPGHTEILADLSGTTDYAMMMANDELRTVLVTVHQSLRTALDAITTVREFAIIRLTHRMLRHGGLAAPRIAVAGLNSHAGENGLFGREDPDVIAPAIELTQREGIQASGPWPADTVFMKARAGHFDAVVAQYHDQGLIPRQIPRHRTRRQHHHGLPFAGQPIAADCRLAETEGCAGVDLLAYRATDADPLDLVHAAAPQPPVVWSSPIPSPAPTRSGPSRQLEPTPSPSAPRPSTAPFSPTRHHPLPTGARAADGHRPVGPL